MRLRGAACAIVVALATCTIALAAAPASTASCGPAQARTLASSRQARVYARNGTVYGCAGKPQYRLGSVREQCSPCFDLVAVSGTVAAYASTIIGYDSAVARVTVRSLEDGERLFDSPAMRADPRAEPDESVGSLVAKRDGHVAWIVVSRGIGGPSHRIVKVHRGDVVLDRGRTIHPDSLKLHGTLLSWKHGTQTRTATLR